MSVAGTMPMAWWTCGMPVGSKALKSRNGNFRDVDMLPCVGPPYTFPVTILLATPIKKIPISCPGTGLIHLISLSRNE